MILGTARSITAWPVTARPLMTRTLTARPGIDTVPTQHGFSLILMYIITCVYDYKFIFYLNKHNYNITMGIIFYFLLFTFGIYKI